MLKSQSGVLPPPKTNIISKHVTSKYVRSVRGRLTLALKAQPDGNGDTWRIYEVKIPAAADPGKDDYTLHPALLSAVAKKLSAKNPSKLPTDSITLVRKSFDARKADNKVWTYVVDVPQEAVRAVGGRLKERQGTVERVPSSQPAPALPQGGQSPTGTTKDPVVVIGSGPAGLFAALEMALAGIQVVLLERGQPVEVRGRDIGALFVRKQMNAESNLCYGEGGAGTWSDGKLTTRIGRNEDPVRYVLQTLTQLGAPEHILLAGKPHLGTDRMVRILKAFREQLQALGVHIRFGTRVSELILQKGRAVGVRLDDGSEIAAAKVVLAVGHSARDMYTHLHSLDVALSPKPFAMGFRIEHPQALIDTIQYGAQDAAEYIFRGKGPMPVADYRLATTIPSDSLPSEGWSDADAWYSPLYSEAGNVIDNNNNNNNNNNNKAAVSSGLMPSKLRDAISVFSFCNCPGGQIVLTGTNPEELCINGMSFSRRESTWANSALVATVGAADWAHHVPRHGSLAGMQLQRDIEREAARRGGGDFVVPVQRASDFVAGRPSSGQLPTSSYRLGIKAAPLHDLYPPYMTEAFRAALLRFESQMPGFLGDEALIHAAETRTSAPVRIDRGEDTSSISTPGLHPCGEGAGYAGGIMSAAVDGLRVGRAIAAELTGRAEWADKASDFKVISSY